MNLLNSTSHHSYKDYPFAAGLATYGVSTAYRKPTLLDRSRWIQLKKDLFADRSSLASALSVDPQRLKKLAKTSNDSLLHYIFDRLFKVNSREYDPLTDADTSISDTSVEATDTSSSVPSTPSDGEYAVGHVEIDHCDEQKKPLMALAERCSNELRLMKIVDANSTFKKALATLPNSFFIGARNRNDLIKAEATEMLTLADKELDKLDKKELSYLKKQGLIEPIRIALAWSLFKVEQDTTKHFSNRWIIPQLALPLADYNKIEACLLDCYQWQLPRTSS